MESTMKKMLKGLNEVDPRLRDDGQKSGLEGKGI